LATWDKTDRFLRDYEDLSADERDAFMAAVRDFVEDLPSRQFRPSLRVKGVQGSHSVSEMSWADDGRATWRYGPEVMKGHPHIIWRRIGGHDIFANP
jgi:hypothetical protein